jgi:methylenetetrahydrofolate dehydrogenase (NADP+)/methenyltetrahydrofolate cyclohydrolase
MAAIIMDGRAVSAALMPELRRHAEELSARHGVSPGLAAVLVGNDPASRQYVRNKQRYAAELPGLRASYSSSRCPKESTSSSSSTRSRR